MILCVVRIFMNQTLKVTSSKKMKTFIDFDNGTPCISIASNNQANFGTTVTVIVSKKEPNLKSSLKKPKVISDEDEGFIDEISANNSTDIINNANKKVVQFKTQITEIPTLEIKSHHTRSRAAAATILPPLRCEIFVFYSNPSLKTRERLIY